MISLTQSTDAFPLLKSISESVREIRLIAEVGTSLLSRALFRKYGGGGHLAHQSLKRRCS